MSAEFICWDINRLQQYINSGKEREEISIELPIYGGSISALQAVGIDSKLKKLFMHNAPENSRKHI